MLIAHRSAVVLMFKMPGESYSGPLPPLTDQEAAVRDALRAHVDRLAGQIGERHVRLRANLDAAADYVSGRLASAGYKPTDQPFTIDWQDLAGQSPVRNIEVELPGRLRAGEIIVVGAHYDSAVGTPGADDNASAVAAMLELARLLSDQPVERTIRFVAFVNEEPPFFRSEWMGSRVYAKRCRQREENVVAMFSLEMLGFYSDQPNSQGYPFPLGLMYPRTGDFIGFVGNWRSRTLVARSVDAFRAGARFPSQGGAVPGVVWAVSLSDHWSFWKEGYPAVMVTDTSFFRNPNYHEATDTPETLDYERTARVTAGLAKMLVSLACGDGF